MRQKSERPWDAAVRTVTSSRIVALNIMRKEGEVNVAESFNYIAFGNWDLVEGNVDHLMLGRGRLFEYTPTDTEKRLEALDPEAIDFIESLPTFLCSEVRLQNDQTVQMYIKLGRVSDILPGPKEVGAHFETLIDFGEAAFENLDAARSVFGADPLQLYRTHWAIREGNAQEVVNRLIELHPELNEMIAERGVVFDRAQETEPPPRNKNTLGTAASVEAFLRLLYEAPEKQTTETFFRGHSDSRYELTPSLLRKWENGTWQYMPSEDRLCKELLIAHYDEFQSDEYCFDRLVRMQHYGLPTRLLDVTSNPLMALYFACSSKSGESGRDGEVIVFKVDKDKLKYYDSDTVSCISNLSNMTYEQKNNINISLGLDDFNQSEVVEKLLHHIKSEKGYFEARMIPDDLGSIVCVKAKRTNTRIKSQSGAFLVFGHEANLPDAGQEGIEISRVTIKNKKEILEQLDRININATTVYPSIDETAYHLRELHQTPRLG